MEQVCDKMHVLRGKGLLVTLCILVACQLTFTSGLAVMSIDLGTEFMKVAIVKPGVPMEIALNDESKRKTAVIVSMRNGERLFSDPALNTAVKYPKMAYRYIQDLIGKSPDNDQVKQFQSRFPFYDLHEDADTNTLYFRHDEETTYTPEELLAMILEKAKGIADAFAEQPVTDCVVTVPPFFTQSERRAMVRAADLAGLKLLQLMNDNTAVAFNYGIFRRKSFNSTAVHYMFFDMGASSTVATVVSYQLVKEKNKVTGIAETNPQLTVKGVGFDRNLGGLEFQLRLRDHLAKLFNEQKKTKTDVTTNNRAMAKLLKEAGRLKSVLSANTQMKAQVEGLLEDHDFAAVVTRAEFEEMCKDLFDRVAKPVEEAMKLSEVTWDEISEVILMGGGTRVPGVQDALKKAIGREELGKGINTDEAAALGAVYQAAYLSKGFRVQPFVIKDATIYPIQVEFERVRTGEDNTESSKTVKRTLFGLMNPYPQKKVMTFNKHTKDFKFEVNYGDLTHLTEAQLSQLGPTLLQSYSLTGVETLYTKYSTDAESKGVKAHFRVDESGILTLEKAEFNFERAGASAEEEESTLSKLGSFFFGGSDGKAEEINIEELMKDIKEKEAATADTEQDQEVKSDEETNNDKPTETKESESDQASKETEEKGAEDSKSEEKTEEKKDEESDKKTDGNQGDKKEGETKEGDKKETKEGEAKEEKKEKKKAIIKEPIDYTASFLDMPNLNDELVKSSKNKIAELKKRDIEKHKLEKVKNDLESFWINTRDKLWQDAYEKCSTEEEREEWRTLLSAAEDWFYETEEDTKRSVYEDKVKEVKKPFKELFERVKEYEDRPRALEALHTVMNYSEHFLAGMKNLTGEDMPFTEVEFTTLHTLITTTKEWNTTSHADQAKLSFAQKPVLLVEDIGKHVHDLDREVKYLLNKLKIFKPKAKPKKEESNTTESNTIDGSPPPAPAEEGGDEEPNKEKTSETSKEKSEDKEAEEILELGPSEPEGEDSKEEAADKPDKSKKLDDEL